MQGSDCNQQRIATAGPGEQDLGRAGQSRIAGGGLEQSGIYTRRVKSDGGDDSRVAAVLIIQVLNKNACVVGVARLLVNQRGVCVGGVGFVFGVPFDFGGCGFLVCWDFSFA